MVARSACAVFESLRVAGSNGSLPATIPPYLYGCAWKKGNTADLVYQALATGFKGIDVAAQPKHYREDLAGEGMRRALAAGHVKRGELFIQTKFTQVAGQDPKTIPYDPNASVTEQVRSSVAQSLHNLRVADDAESPGGVGTYIDSIVLHSPLRRFEQTLEAWRALEEFCPVQVKFLGISNTTLPVLQELYDAAKVKPSFVQNRFYRDTAYDVALRAWCRERDIIYQSFWTLTANPALLNLPAATFLAKEIEVDPAVALYALVMALEKTIVLNGTTSHMESDLVGLQKVRAWASQDRNKYQWENTVKGFKDLIGENM